MLAVLSAFLLVAARGTNVPNLPPGPNAPLVPQSYLIQPGDTLAVKFVKNPELNEQPTVAPDGRISMLYAPNLEVAGKSTEVRVPGPTKVVLVRRTDDNQKKAYLMNYDAAARGEKPSDDIQLANYDVLFVPKTGVADVYTAYNQYFK
jgi:protein involved in polysaccharide export with SLBB domain